MAELALPALGKLLGSFTGDAEEPGPAGRVFCCFVAMHTRRAHGEEVFPVALTLSH